MTKRYWRFTAYGTDGPIAEGYWDTKGEVVYDYDSARYYLPIDCRTRGDIEDYLRETIPSITTIAGSESDDPNTNN